MKRVHIFTANYKDMAKWDGRDGEKARKAGTRRWKRKTKDELGKK